MSSQEITPGKAGLDFHTPTDTPLCKSTEIQIKWSQNGVKQESGQYEHGATLTGEWMV